MNCNDVKNVLVDRYFEELEGVDAKDIDEHLKLCRDCFREYLSIKQSIEYLDRGLTASTDIDKTLKDVIKADLRREYGRSFWQLVSFRIPAYAAFGAVAAGVLLTLALTGPLALRSPEKLSSAERENQSLTAVKETHPNERAARLVLAKYYDSIALQSKEVF